MYIIKFMDRNVQNVHTQTNIKDNTPKIPPVECLAVLVIHTTLSVCSIYGKRYVRNLLCVLCIFIST